MCALSSLAQPGFGMPPLRWPGRDPFEKTDLFSPFSNSMTPPFLPVDFSKDGKLSQMWLPSRFCLTFFPISEGVPSPWLWPLLPELLTDPEDPRPLFPPSFPLSG